MPRTPVNVKDMSKFKNEYLEVIERHIDYSSKLAKWLCKCNCGKLFIAVGADIRQGKTKTCGCRTSIKSKRNWQGYGQINKGYWSNICRGAATRGIEFSITIEYIDELYTKQNGVCALSGIELSLDRRTQTASIDRIDNNKGYVIGNVQWVHKDVNKLKGIFDTKTLLYLCEKIAEHNRNLLT